MSQRKQLRARDEAEAEELLDEARDPIEVALDSFLADGMIAEVLYPVKRGKEAMVYCCRAGAATGRDLVAAKVYRPADHRAFKNSAVYEEGYAITNGQVRRALAKKTRFGRQVHFGLWIHREYEALTTLARAGAPVPRPIAENGQALLMEYFGDRAGAAASLGGIDLPRERARVVFDTILDAVALCLASHYVHGDLSAYNILYWQNRPRIIDFPQAVDARVNSNALALLTRDLENVCRAFTRYGLEYNGRALAAQLWQKYRTARL